MENITVAMLGGDLRQSAAAEQLAKQGIKVKSFGMEMPQSFGGIEVVPFFEAAVRGATAVILPIPVSGDGVHLYCPLLSGNNPPKIGAVLEALEGVTVFGGRISPQIKALAEKRGIRMSDYYDSEDVKIKNAVPTAEGAVEAAMRVLKRTIHGSRTAVVGYGRIGKTLSETLRSLGSEVTVAARKSADLVWASSRCFSTLRIAPSGSSSTLSRLCSGYDVIFNTVPFWLFDGELLSAMSRETVIIDLASAPGGVEPDAAKKHGIKVIQALSLPAKYAPITAGEIIGDSVYALLCKEGLVL